MVPMLLFHGKLILLLFTYVWLGDAASEKNSKQLQFRRPLLPQVDSKLFAQKEMASIIRSLSPTLDKPNARPVLQHPSAGKIGKNIARQIVGGADAILGQFPWQALITIDDSSLCGGSLILEDWILTAAHCVQKGTSFSVTLGTINQKSPSADSVTLVTTDKYVHPQYDANLLINDIALLKLPELVTLSDSIALIALPPLSDANTTFVGTMGKISGFGLTKDKSSSSETLKFIDDKIVSNSECVKWFGTSSILSSSICTKTLKKSSCQGDSGGPLVYLDYGQTWRQIGVVSFGSDRCLKGPSVYTRVTSHLGWISETVEQDVAGTTDPSITTPPTTTTKAPKCFRESFKTVDVCCNIPNAREFVKKKKSEKTCNARDVDFQIFNVFKLNKYQNKDTNQIDIADEKLSKELAKTACVVNCYLTTQKVMAEDGTIDKEMFATFMQHAQRVNSTWLPVIEQASSDCYDMTLAIPIRPFFAAGKSFCDSTATMMVQCVLYKVIENCPEIRQDAKCLKKFPAFRSCGSSISYFKA